MYIKKSVKYTINYNMISAIPFVAKVVLILRQRECSGTDQQAHLAQLHKYSNVVTVVINSSFVIRRAYTRLGDRAFPVAGPRL